MQASRTLRSSIAHVTTLKNPKPLLQWRHQARRWLILEAASRQFVGLRRLSGLDSGIVEVSLNRAETRNAIGKALLSGLRSALDEVSGDSLATVVLLRSSVPKAFCAGADLKERQAQSPSEILSFVNSLGSTLSALETLRIPTIAVIEGAALGGGLEMALSCDIRICGEDAILGLPETGLAIIPGAGGTQRLPRLVGKAKAMELIFTGKKISGSAAFSIGLVNHCVPSGEAHSKALEIAREINKKGSVAIKMAKRAINEGMEVNTASGLEVERDCYAQLFDTHDRLEGLKAFAEKRKPNYTGK